MRLRYSLTTSRFGGGEPDAYGSPDWNNSAQLVDPSVLPAAVYRAFLSSKEHAQFTGSEARCSARVGGRFMAWDTYISGKNIKLVTDQMIVQEWKTSEWPEGYEPSILKITLKKEGEGTRLSTIQSRIPASQVDQYDKG